MITDPSTFETIGISEKDIRAFNLAKTLGRDLVGMRYGAVGDCVVLEVERDKWELGMSWGGEGGGRFGPSCFERFGHNEVAQ
jgi:hypothetical protein